MLEIELVKKIIDIFADGFRDGPMWATGLLVMGAWFIINIYHKYQKKYGDKGITTYAASRVNKS